jgi:hypothetical protein
VQRLVCSCALLVVVFAAAGCGRIGYDQIDKGNDSGVEEVDSGEDSRPGAGALQNTNPGPDLQLYLAMAGALGATSYVKSFAFNRDTNAIVEQVELVAIPGGSARSIDVDRTGKLVISSHLSAAPIVTISLQDGKFERGPDLVLKHDLNPSRSADILYALCFLPSGNFITGNMENAPGNTVNEYDPSGRMVRSVYDLPAGVGAPLIFSFCISRSDVEFYALEATFGAGEARLLRFVRAATTTDWFIADAVRMADLETKFGSVGDEPTAFTFVLDPETELLYLPPLIPGGSQVDRFIQCPAVGFDVGSCTLVGEPIPAGRIYAAARIPATTDLLVSTAGWVTPPSSTAHHLYRFSPVTGNWTKLYDLTTMDLGGDTYSEPGQTYKMVNGLPIFR